MSTIQIKHVTFSYFFHSFLPKDDIISTLEKSQVKNVPINLYSKIMHTEVRPWGQFTNIYDKAHSKVKTIQVNPGQRLSLQSHEKRAETWVVIRGLANVQIDDELFTLNVGESIQIPVGAKHRLQNAGSELLEIIEVKLEHTLEKMTLFATKMIIRGLRFIQLNIKIKESEGP